MNSTNKKKIPDKIPYRNAYVTAPHRSTFKSEEKGIPPKNQFASRSTKVEQEEKTYTYTCITYNSRIRILAGEISEFNGSPMLQLIVPGLGLEIGCAGRFT